MTTFEKPRPMSLHVYFPFYEFAPPPFCMLPSLSSQKARTTSSLNLLLGLQDRTNKDTNKLASSLHA